MPDGVHHPLALGDEAEVAELLERVRAMQPREISERTAA